MASQPGFVESEEHIIRTICKPKGCVYARDDGRCGTKYADEAVIDFAGDGCQQAAIKDPTDTRKLVLLEEVRVIPGIMTREGFTPFPTTITRQEHQNGMVNVEGQIIYPHST